eukprot:PITA_22432
MLETIKKASKHFRWTDAAERGFQLLKKKITERPILRLPNIKKLFQSFAFVSKHISRQANKVADVLSRRALLLQESTVQVLDFEHLKDLYQNDTDFKEAYEACQNPLVRDNSPSLDYNLQEKLQFRGGKLCIPNCSMRENIIQEKHIRGLARHFSMDKTLE